MIKELINFTENIGEEFKNLGSSPKEGLHILMRFHTDESGKLSLNTSDFDYEFYSQKQKSENSVFIDHCKLLQINSWMIDTNKCFDTITRAIHTCSPFSIAIKRDNLKGGKNFEKRKKEGKNLVYESFETYFNKAFSLFSNEDEQEKYVLFKKFFSENQFSSVLKKIEEERAIDFNALTLKIEELKKLFKAENDKTIKESLKAKISDIEQELLKTKPLEDSSYIIFYLDLPVDKYKEVYKKYLDDKLFNTSDYNTTPNEQGIIYGTNNFQNGYSNDKPFLLHHTASFDISNRISNTDAKLLNDLNNIFRLSTRILPNPVPIFVYKEELQKKVIGIFKESGFSIKYIELIKTLLDNYKTDLSNYYLLFWKKELKGTDIKIVFNDFDYVSKFEYEIKNLIIHNLFEIKEKDGKTDKRYPLIKTVFDLEEQVLKKLIENKSFKVDYFKDLDPEDYKDRTRTPNILYSNRFISFSKYRKAVYDYVYKSQRNSIDGTAFHEMIFNSILDDVKNNNDYGIKEKLNIWYSLFDYFNPKKNINMINKLKEYQDFVSAIIEDEELKDITDEKFAFAAGQVIEYILSKSKSADNSYNLLEPYLQQSKCAEFKKAIANDFGRYKHENFSKNFEKVAAFVLSYETSANLKHLLPQILSGAFAKNQLFSTNK